MTLVDEEYYPFKQIRIDKNAPEMDIVLFRERDESFKESEDTKRLYVLAQKGCEGLPRDEIFFDNLDLPRLIRMLKKAVRKDKI
jgi:hypothetical protein